MDFPSLQQMAYVLTRCSGEECHSFDSNAGTYILAGFAVDESTIFAKYSDGSRKGVHVKRYPVSLNGTCSNDDTTLTLNGGGSFDIVYTKTEHGIADGLSAISYQKGSQDCVLNLVAVIQ